MIDIHTHLLPEFDDGPKDLDETRKMLALAEKDGTTEVVLTSHILNPSDHEREDEILEKFARRIAHRIDAARTSGDFRHLILVAAPALLGAIRPILSHSSRQLIVGEVSKNLAHHEAADIQKILDRELG